MKIRIERLKDERGKGEYNTLTALLGMKFRILKEKGPYPNRSSQYERMYLEVKGKEED